MLKFVDFSSISEDAYLIVDKDLLYRWHVQFMKSKLLREWLNNRDVFDFRLEHDDSITSIAVYKGSECLLCEEIDKVEYI